MSGRDDLLKEIIDIASGAPAPAGVRVNDAQDVLFDFDERMSRIIDAAQELRALARDRGES